MSRPWSTSARTCSTPPSAPTRRDQVCARPSRFSTRSEPPGAAELDPGGHIPAAPYVMASRTPRREEPVMLGRNSYEPEELENARTAVKKQLADWRAPRAGGDVETTYFNSPGLSLGRPVVHRIRKMTGKDTNPLSEVELVVDSLMAGGRFDVGTVVKYQPEESVLGLRPGEEIRLGADDYEKLATAFIAELEKRSAG